MPKPQPVTVAFPLIDPVTGSIVPDEWVLITAPMSPFFIDQFAVRRLAIGLGLHPGTPLFDQDWLEWCATLLDPDHEDAA